MMVCMAVTYPHPLAHCQVSKQHVLAKIRFPMSEVLQQLDKTRPILLKFNRRCAVSELIEFPARGYAFGPGHVQRPPFQELARETCFSRQDRPFPGCHEHAITAMAQHLVGRHPSPFCAAIHLEPVGSLPEFQDVSLI